MVVTKIKDGILKFTNPYYELIKNRWQFLQENEIRQSAKYLDDNTDIIERFYHLINKKNIDKENTEKILDFIDEFAHYNASSPSFPIIHKYIEGLKRLDDLIEDIKKGYFPFQKYNVAKPQPNSHYIEIAFGINIDPKNQKETLTEILEIIGDIWARGYPISYYGNNSPIQYYIEINNNQNQNNNQINLRFFIRRDIPSEMVGYLLYRLNNIRQKKLIVPPKGNQYFIIGNGLGIDQDPSKDKYTEEILISFKTLQKIY
jgi:hypothetical protein